MNISKRLRFFATAGDGDYKLLVDFLIEEKRFEKILFPDQKSRSSLYKQLFINYLASLDDPDVKNKISYERKRKGALGS